jgi:hypothetical protein
MAMYAGCCVACVSAGLIVLLYAKNHSLGYFLLGLGTGWGIAALISAGIVYLARRVRDPTEP